MRYERLALLALTAAVALGGCDDEERSSETRSTTDAATTAAPAPKPAEPPFPATVVFSGDDVQKCLEGKGLSAPREPKPAADDKVGQGIVHDRLLVGSRRTVLRLFMFGSADLAREQGKLVAARSPEAQVLGTTIFEPLGGGPSAKETGTVIGCLEEQAGD